MYIDDLTMDSTSFWYFSPTSYFLSWPSDGTVNQAARVAACAVSSPGNCVDGTVAGSSSSYGQLAGIESHVATTQCLDIHAGYSSGDCSTTTAVGKPEETWYRYKVRFPVGYKHLAYLQTKVGYKVKVDMPGVDGPETDKLYALGAKWLKGENKLPW